MEKYEKYSRIRADRDTVHALFKAGTFTPDAAKDTLQEAQVYPDKQKWLLYLDRFLLSLGAVFLLCGIVFFLAYNWTEIGKFAKLGMVEGAMVLVTVFLLFKKKEDYPFHIGITSVAVLTGVLLALYGQIYQTGANAYDFFLQWSLMVIPLSVIGRFPPLWLLHLVLFNTTFILYANQVLNKWEAVYFVVLFGINVLPLIAWEAVMFLKGRSDEQRWWPRTAGTAAVIFLSIGCNGVIADNFRHDMDWVCLLVMAIAYALAIPLYILKIKDLFLLAVIFLSVISVLTTSVYQLIDAVEDGEAIAASFVSGAVSLACTTVLIKVLLDINKKWRTAS